MNVNLFFVNIIMCNSFVLYNQDDHQIVCKINIFIVIVDIISVLTTFFGSDRSPGRGNVVCVCVCVCVRVCMCASVTLFKRTLKMSSGSILKSPGGF